MARLTGLRWALLFLAALASFASVVRAAPTPLSEIKTALVVFAHPDDAETICGGLVARLIQEYNATVYYAVTTLGQGGWHSSYNVTREEVGEIRRQEQLNAAKVLGVKEVFFFGLEDGETEGVDPVALKTNITKVIRTTQPDVLITFDQNLDYWGFKQGLIHRDHLVAGKGALDSAYPQARDWLAVPEIYPQYQPWDTNQVWLFNWEQVNTNGDENSPEEGVVVDITSVFDLKYQALLQHKSQYSNASDVLESLQTIGSIVAKRNNQPADVIYAEAYTVVEVF